MYPIANVARLVELQSNGHKYDVKAASTRPLNIAVVPYLDVIRPGWH
jgi:hypothetical protein